MKNVYAFFMALMLTGFGFAQDLRKDVSSRKATSTRTPVAMWSSMAARDFPQATAQDRAALEGRIIPRHGAETSQELLSPKRRRKLEWMQSAGPSPTSKDELVTAFKADHAGKAPIVNFDGISLDVQPPDPSMAVGPNHVVTMENGQWAVYNKSGVMAAGFPKQLTAPLQATGATNNAGDPVVMYDREADRWFISQFQLPNSNNFLIGVSKTPDPTGEYWVYKYDVPAQNDYPHYGIWGDSYVAAGNFDGANKVYAWNRTKMLAGDSSAEMSTFAPPGLAGSGFTAPIPAHSEGAGAATGPAKIVYYQDDAWSGVSTDHVGLWNLNLNWANPASSTVSAKIEIPVTAFDAAFTGGFANIAQPGTAQRIDVIMGAVMNMCHWYKFGSHESILLNWPVEITDGSLISGIRWVELRSTNGGTTWTKYQEGTFTDPSGNESVWMGCMAMDKQGNIGLGYTKSGTTTFPSLYYTGRMANAPLGTMNVTPVLAVAGTNATTGERYGDYGQGVRDPNDDLTFWVTSEYSGSPRKVRVYSFKLGTDFNKDVGVTAIVNPATGSGLTNAETVTVTIKNHGNQPQSNFPVELKVGGTTIATETYTGTLAAQASANFTFAAKADLSTVGTTYSIEVCTKLTGDENVNNDCNTKSVQHLVGNDVGVIAITAPNSGSGLGATETVTITVRNFGGNAQSNIPVQYTINGGAAVTGTVPGPIAAGATGNYSFTTTANLATNGSYNICSKTLLVGDQNLTNDSFCKTVTKISCIPTSTNCNSDGIKQFQLGTINTDDGASGCNTEPAGNQGFADRTNLSTDLERSSGNNVHTLKARYNYDGGTAIKLCAWIDFNDNGTFETSERLINDGTFSAFNSLVDFTLTIPTTANLGTHRMRVRAGDSSGNPGTVNDPCSNLEYGETQDYTVKIVDSTLSIADDTLANGEFSVIYGAQTVVELSTSQKVGAIKYNVYNQLGQRVITGDATFANGKYTAALNMSNQATGVYIVTFDNNKVTRTTKVLVK